MDLLSTNTIVVFLSLVFSFSYLGSSARKVMPFDKLSLICPNTVEYPIKRRDSYSRDELYENIFMVDKRGYDNCNATGGFKILLCDNPMACRHTTLVFKQVSASAEDPEFHPGREYYFISKDIYLVYSFLPRGLWAYPIL